MGNEKLPLALLALVLKPAEPKGTTAYFVTPSVEATGNRKDERKCPHSCHFEERSDEESYNTRLGYKEPIVPPQRQSLLLEEKVARLAATDEV